MRIALEDFNLANAERAIIKEALCRHTTLEAVAEACGVTLSQLKRKMTQLDIKMPRVKGDSRKRKEGKK